MIHEDPLPSFVLPLKLKAIFENTKIKGQGYQMYKLDIAH